MAKSGSPNADHIRYTLVTSSTPRVLTKTFSLECGALVKRSSASICEGRAEVVSARELSELSDQLDQLSSNQAVTWGLAKSDSRIVTTRQLAKIPTAISRSREYFRFGKGPGVLMIDHDGMPGKQLSATELRETLIEVFPEMFGAPMLVRASASGGICNAQGELLTKASKHRIYVAVRDASQIPSAGRRLITRLFAKNLGWYEVGAAGQMIERALIDGSVFQPERLDFAANPVLLDGLIRKVDGIELFNETRALFDLSLIQTTDEIERAAEKRRRSSRLAVKEESETKRYEWALEKSAELANEQQISLDQAHSTLICASANHVLTGDFVLTSEEGVKVCVNEILDDADKWHRSRFADPLGDYPGDNRIAMAVLKGGPQAYLSSFGHGNQRFELRRQSARIETGKGRRVETTDETLKVLRDRGELFDFGDNGIAHVSDGRARSVNVDWLVDHMDRVADYYYMKNIIRGGLVVGREERPDDAPIRVAQIILAKVGQRDFKKLQAVITAPTLRRDGSVLDKPGYDESSELYYSNENDVAIKVPTEPTAEDAIEALRFLWKAFSKFPFVDNAARGVTLQAIFTATLRASLPTAPGTGFDAPAAGTGKTLLARAIGAFITGGDVMTFAPVASDEEMRKRLFASLRDGNRVILLDNFRDPLGGAALDAFFTASHFSDRILGESTTSSLPNRALFIATGNNLRTTGDTYRRILVARLDANVERAYAREFGFDPVDMVIENRMCLVVCVLTIIRAWIAAGRPRVNSPGRFASFEVWDELVRKPLCWLAEVVAFAKDKTDLPTFSDPIKVIESAFEIEPETAKLSALLSALRAAFGNFSCTIAQIIDKAREDDELREAIDEIAGEKYEINRRRLGRWVERHVGQIIAGLKLKRVGVASSNVALWAVFGTEDRGPVNPSKPANPGKI